VQLVILVRFPVYVYPPVSLNVLPTGEAGNTEQPGKYVADMATPVGMVIVTVVAGDFGTVPTRTKLPLKVVIVNDSHVIFVPVFVPVRSVVYTKEWVKVVPTNLKVWSDALGSDIS